MKRTVMLTLVAVMAAAPASAQVRFIIGAPADSAVGLRPNTATLVPVFVEPSGFNVQRVRLTFVYDPTKMEIEAVAVQCCSGLYQTVDTSRSPGRFSFGGSGFISTFGQQRALDLRVRLLTGVTDGTFLMTQVDTLSLQFFGNAPDRGLSFPGQMCHATDIFGDVDANFRVDSRDALITLSAAVGLPVTGFNLSQGDVDADSLVNSRDALMMLSYSIGAFTPANRVASGIPDVCPPLTPLADRIVWIRQGATQDSLFTLAPGSTVPAYVPNTSDVTGEVLSPRLASNGTRIAYECRPAATFTIPRICLIDTDGQNLADITPGGTGTFAERPDWSPGDTVLTTIQSSFLHRMDPTGANDQFISNPSFSIRGGAAWSRDAQRIVYSDGSFFNLRLINPDGTGDTPIAIGPGDAYVPRWNPAGDTVAFTRTSFGGIWAATPAGSVMGRLTNIAVPLFDEYDWTPEGLLFGIDRPGLRGLWLLPNGGGVIRRVTRGRDMQPASRRNP